MRSLLLSLLLASQSLTYAFGCELPTYSGNADEEILGSVKVDARFEESLLQKVPRESRPPTGLCWRVAASGYLLAGTSRASRQYMFVRVGKSWIFKDFLDPVRVDI